MRLSRSSLLLSCLLLGCGGRMRAGDAPMTGPADPRATAETKALLTNLRAIAREHVLFGHEDDLAYGYDWIGEAGRSDVKDVAGSYPAVYGWDISHLETRSATNIDSVPFEQMREWIRDGYRRGGVITLSWHVNNPVTGGNAWDTTSAVAAVLPGGLRHAEFMQSLDRVAEFISSLRGPGRTGKDAAIPVIFRPFHEMSGGWFWWGAGHAAPAEYRELWMFTVHYLRDVKGVHNVLYAYAPNAFNSGPMTQYWTQYPGDDYVDVLGWDEYFHAPRAGDTTNAAASLTSHLHWLVEQAESRGKVPALTETGYQAIPDPTWWTGTLLAALDADPVARRIAYLLVWRNAHRDAEHQDHFFAPYRGHASAADFVRFHDAPLTWFENDLPDVYREARR